MTFTLSPLKKPLTGELHVPGDKSISHRAIMLGSIAKGKTTIQNFLNGEDCLHTIKIFQQFGVNIEQNETEVIISSNGYKAFEEPLEPLYFGNSGTTARLILGILSNLPFHTVMHGDPFLTIRPMDRVVIPLRKMGASINGRNNGTLLPLAINGKQLEGIHYSIPVKSAQVKSAILLAGLFANNQTTVVELAQTRDHTENMLEAFGAHIKRNGLEVTISNKNELTPVNIVVPGDISSAAFFLVAASIVPNSCVMLKNVGLNKTRTGIIEVMLKMGANIEIVNEQISGGEPIGDIIIRSSPLKGITISDQLIPTLIDEIPIIALLATQAEGNTIIKDAEELRVKETDRIKAVVDVLTTLGASIQETKDGMIIHGGTTLVGGKIKSYSDHRIAMMGAVASFICEGDVEIDDISSIAISYPSFFNHIKKLTNNK